MQKFSIPKVITARYHCPQCKETSFLDIDPHGDYCGHMQCFNCNVVFHVYCPTIGGAITIAMLSADEAVGVFKLQEKYKDAPIPFVLRKTKLREQLL